MSIVYDRKAKCPKCGSEEKFTVVASWNYMFGEHPNPKNECSKCGTKLSTSDVTEPDYFNRVGRNLLL